MVAEKVYRFFDGIGWMKSAYLFFRMTREIVAGIDGHINQGDIRNIKRPPDRFDQLMRTKVLKELGLENMGWDNCNGAILLDILRMDRITDFSPILEKLLNGNVTMMFYYGKYDYICNTMAGEKMFDHLKWWGAEGFKKETERYLWANGNLKENIKNTKICGTL